MVPLLDFPLHGLMYVAVLVITAGGMISSAGYFFVVACLKRVRGASMCRQRETYYSVVSLIAAIPTILYLYLSEPAHSNSWDAMWILPVLVTIAVYLLGIALAKSKLGNGQPKR